MGVFNIRVYGILINERKDVLVTDEFRFGKQMNKFPGGGLNWGEGTIDCLKREFREELGCEIEVIKHFYTTDFFQPSAFHADHQLISIYYIVKNTTPFSPPLKGESAQSPFSPPGLTAIRQPDRVILAGTGDLGHNDKTEGAQSFRWLPVSELNAKEFTFPIDKKVVVMLYNPPQSNKTI